MAGWIAGRTSIVLEISWTNVDCPALHFRDALANPLDFSFHRGFIRKISRLPCLWYFFQLSYFSIERRLYFFRCVVRVPFVGRLSRPQVVRQSFNKFLNALSFLTSIDSRFGVLVVVLAFIPLPHRLRERGIVSEDISVKERVVDCQQKFCAQYWIGNAH